MPFFNKKIKKCSLMNIFLNRNLNVFKDLNSTFNIINETPAFDALSFTALVDSLNNKLYQKRNKLGRFIVKFLIKGQECLSFLL